ncbi:MAG: hypothetical protein QXP88_01715 [Thermoproteota archaeon]
MLLLEENTDKKSLNKKDFLKFLVRYYRYTQDIKGVEDLINTYLNCGTKKYTSSDILLAEFSKALQQSNEPLRKLRRRRI